MNVKTSYISFAFLLILSCALLYKFAVSKLKSDSSLQKEVRSTWDRWERAFIDPNEYLDSAMGEIITPIHHKLNKLLNPVDCSKSSFVVMEYGASVGFGAQLTELVAAFAASLLSNRILILNDSLQFLWADGCPEGPYVQCYFQNFSSCSLEAVRSHIKDGRFKHILFDPENEPYGETPDIPDADPSVPSVVSFEHGRNFFTMTRDGSHLNRVLFHLIGDSMTKETKHKFNTKRLVQRASQISLSTYLTRLNSKTATYVRSTIENIMSFYKLDGDDFYKLIGVPVRKSDKCYNNTIWEFGEMECVELRDAIESAGRIAFSSPSITYALVTSEDESVLNETKRHPERSTFMPLKIITNFLDLPPGSGRNKMRTDKSKYELMKAMLVTLHLQSFAGFHVLTPRSCFHSVIVAYANAFPGKSRYSFFPLGAQPNMEKSELWTLLR